MCIDPGYPMRRDSVKPLVRTKEARGPFREEGRRKGREKMPHSRTPIRRHHWGLAHATLKLNIKTWNE